MRFIFFLFALILLSPLVSAAEVIEKEYRKLARSYGFKLDKHPKFHSNISGVRISIQETEQELDDCHKQLIEILGKPERKLVLRIIDGKDRLADEIGLDSFIFGFKLATQLAHELKKYDGHLRSDAADEDVRRSILLEEED